MPTTIKKKKVKTSPKKEIKEVIKETKEKAEKAAAYFYGLGKRKTSIAQVRIYPVEKSEKGIMVNDKKIENFFGIERLSNLAMLPLVTAGQDGKFDVSVKVSGGGITGQAEAIRLGISRALIKFDINLRKILKSQGFLTRDARNVERKKPGLKKARRAPQWAKR